MSVAFGGMAMMTACDRLFGIEGNPIPEGAEVHVLRTADSRMLRSAYFPVDGAARGTVLILPGRSEFIEKYFETVAALRRRGFAVMAGDWRGQGGSERELSNRLKGHIDDFSLYRHDLEVMLAHLAASKAPAPWHALAHSMGAAILIDALADGEARFSRAVLSAPMIGIHGAPADGWPARLALMLNLIGLGGAYVPFSGDKAASAFAPFAGNVLTSDPGRYERSIHILTAAENLALGPPTISWVAAAFRLIRRMAAPGYGLAVRCPSLFIVAGADTVVSSPAAEALAARMRGASCVVIEGARHEVLMEKDRYRDQAWSAFDAFIH